MNMGTLSHYEVMFARMEEIALRSTYAHGKVLTDFSFLLPQHDDVLTLPNGTLALRSDTEDSGYTHEEDVLYHALFPSSLVFTPRLPSSFLQHGDVIVFAHTTDLEEIVRGLIRARASLSASTLYTLAEASFQAHEALLVALHDIFHLHNPSFVTHLFHASYPAFAHAAEVLDVTARRFCHEGFARAISTGIHDQHRELLLAGLASGHDAEFFTARLASPKFI